MRVLDIFSGIGAFSLGLERAGMRTVAFCERDPFCRRVLAKHWPHVPVYDDVRTLTATRLAADGIAVDVICGGFPCQPHSVAGQRNGNADERDLWPEFARLVREIRPRWVVAENVPGLLSSDAGRFFGGILRDLAEAGYDAQWQCISAADMGAPHLRERIWIVAYPESERERPGGYGQGAADCDGWPLVAGQSARSDAHHNGEAVEHTQREDERRRRISGHGEDRRPMGEGSSGQSIRTSQDVADAAGARCGAGQPGAGGPLRYEAWGAEPQRRSGAVANAAIADGRLAGGEHGSGAAAGAAAWLQRQARGGGCADDVADAESDRWTERQPQPDTGGIPQRGEAGRQSVGGSAGLAHPGGAGLSPSECAAVFGAGRRDEGRAVAECGWWSVEPDVGRVAHGVASRVDRLRSLGNSLVPQIPEAIGRAILAAEYA